MKANFLKRLTALLFAVGIAIGIADVQKVVNMPSFRGGSLVDFRYWVIRKAKLTREQRKIEGQTQI